MSLFQRFMAIYSLIILALMFAATVWLGSYLLFGGQ